MYDIVQILQARIRIQVWDNVQAESGAHPTSNRMSTRVLSWG